MLQQLVFRFPSPAEVEPEDPFLPDQKSLSERWACRLGVYCSQPIEVQFHNNSATMISSRWTNGFMKLRLHHMFVHANDAVLKALGGYLTGSRRGHRILNQYIRDNRHKIKKRSSARKFQSLGKHYDLGSIRDALAKHYFKSPIDVKVVWGQKRTLKHRQSIRLGSYCFEEKLVRIHPALDQALVPAYVVVAVVYHELLHHVLGAEQKNQRRRLHGKIFRSREREYLFYQKASQWETQHLGLLLKKNFGTGCREFGAT